VDAEQTNRAVESLRESGREQLYLTLQWLYVQGLGIKATAREMGRAESTVHAYLDQADHALAAWFAAHARQRSLST
jgi:DNA-directed RNA polymerase specialized sigma24 family protein